MHDINGKVLHIGDDVTCSAFGFCRITDVIEEDNGDREGALVSLTAANGNKVSCRILLGTLVKVRTWKEMAEEGLAVQDACNLSGVVHSFSRIITEVRNRLEAEGKGGTHNVNTHPVCVIFANKIASLTGQNGSDFSEAYRWALDQKGT